MTQVPTVFLVDDDDGMRASLEFVLTGAGVPVTSFASPVEFLGAYDVDQPGCLVLDLQLPQMDGLTLWREIRKRGGHHPCIVISGHGSIASAVEAIQTGAVDFLEKPFHHDRLLQQIKKALASDVEQRELRSRQRDLQLKLSQLTPRERQVLDLVLDGKLSKQIAKELEITTKTVEVHRSNVTRKMGVGSVAQLFKRMNDHLVSLNGLNSVKHDEARHDDHVSDPHFTNRPTSPGVQHGKSNDDRYGADPRR